MMICCTGSQLVLLDNLDEAHLKSLEENSINQLNNS